MIEIKNLFFSYGKLEVFNNFNLQIPENQVCLITGINGVGKSTLLRLIAGVLKPDGGDIIFNKIIGEDPRRKIGFISDHLSLYESMTVSQAIDFHKSVYNISKIEDNLLHKTKIRNDQKIKDLSVGQRVILHLSLIISSGPKLLLIDEIIHSIDVYLRRIFLNQLIQMLSSQKLTVVMVNLNFHDIEQIVERVVLIKSGKIAVDEEIEKLKAKVKKIIATTPPQSQTILSKIEYEEHSDYFVYPYEKPPEKGEVINLNLSEIVAAFIGGEYA